MDFINSAVPELSSTGLHTGSVCCLSGVTKLCQGKGGKRANLGQPALFLLKWGFMAGLFLNLRSICGILLTSYQPASEDLMPFSIAGTGMDSQLPCCAVMRVDHLLVTAQEWEGL